MQNETGCIRTLIREPTMAPARHGTREEAATARSKAVISPARARRGRPMRFESRKTAEMVARNLSLMEPGPT